MVSEKKFYFFSFSHYKSMGDNEPRGIASLNPRGLIVRIYVVDHYILLHTKYISSVLMFSEKKIFFKFFPIISL